MKNLGALVETILTYLCFHPVLQPRVPKQTAEALGVFSPYRDVYRVKPTLWGIREDTMVVQLPIVAQ